MQYFLLYSIFSFLSLLSPDSKEWIRTKSNTSNISFKMPLKHQHIHSNQNGIQSEIFQTKDLTCVYGIVASKFKNTNFNQQPIDKIYNVMKEGSLLEQSAVLKSEQTVAYQKMLIKEIQYSIVKEKMEYIYYKRFIFRNNFVYQISIGAFNRHLNELEANKDIFFNSIKF